MLYPRTHVLVLERDASNCISILPHRNDPLANSELLLREMAKTIALGGGKRAEPYGRFGVYSTLKQYRLRQPCAPEHSSLADNATTNTVANTSTESDNRDCIGSSMELSPTCFSLVHRHLRFFRSARLFFN
jgi:hypothetical protein